MCIVQLGFGGLGEATNVARSESKSATTQPRTVYFRTDLTLPADARQQYFACVLEVEVDDGAVVYLNGAVVGRLNMPPRVGFNTKVCARARAAMRVCRARAAPRGDSGEGVTAVWLTGWEFAGWRLELLSVPTHSRVSTH
jgi:hypothetical protein